MYLLEKVYGYTKDSNEYVSITDGKNIMDFVKISGFKPFNSECYHVYCSMDNSLKSSQLIPFLKDIKNTTGLIFLKDYKVYSDILKQVNRLDKTKVEFINLYYLRNSDKLFLFKYFCQPDSECEEYFKYRICWDTNCSLQLIVDLINKNQKVSLDILKEYKPESFDMFTLVFKMLEGKIKRRGKYMRAFYLAVEEKGISWVYQIFRNTLNKLLRFKLLELQGLLNSSQFYEAQEDILEKYDICKNKKQYYNLVKLTKLVTLKELGGILEVFKDKFCDEALFVEKLLYIGQRYID